MVRWPTSSVGRGREALLESQNWLGGLGEVRYPSWRAERGREALPVGRDGLGGTPSEPGEVGRHSPMDRRGWKAAHSDGWGGWKPSQKGRKESGGVGRGRSGRETLPKSRERSVGPGRSEGPPRGLAGVGRSFRRARSGWKALPESQEGSGGPREVRRHSWWARRDQKALPDGQEWLRGSPGGPGGVWEALQEGKERSGGPSGEPGGVEGGG